MSKVAFVYNVVVLGIQKERLPNVTFVPQVNSSDLKLETYILILFLFLASNVKEIISKVCKEYFAFKRHITIV